MAASLEMPRRGADFIVDVYPQQKKPWARSEDEVLVELVTLYGSHDWYNIAFEMNARGVNKTGKQCRERWLNQLSPQVRKEPWSDEEDRTIIEAHKIHGNKWVAISKLLSGRPPNAVKNRWNGTLHRKVAAMNGGVIPYSFSTNVSNSASHSDEEYSAAGSVGKKKRKRWAKTSGDEDDDMEDSSDKDEAYVAKNSPPKRQTPSPASSSMGLSSHTYTNNKHNALPNPLTSLGLTDLLEAATGEMAASTSPINHPMTSRMTPVASSSPKNSLRDSHATNSSLNASAVVSSSSSPTAAPFTQQQTNMLPALPSMYMGHPSAATTNGSSQAGAPMFFQVPGTQLLMPFPGSFDPAAMMQYQYAAAAAAQFANPMYFNPQLMAAAMQQQQAMLAHSSFPAHHSNPVGGAPSSSASHPQQLAAALFAAVPSTPVFKTEPLSSDSTDLSTPHTPVISDGISSLSTSPVPAPASALLQLSSASECVVQGKLNPAPLAATANA